MILDFTYKDVLHSYKSDVSITIDSKELNLRDQLLVDRYYYAVNKGAKLIFEDIETGKPITNPGFLKFDNPPDHPKWIPILEALLLIETTTNTQLSVPKKLSNEEVKLIFNIAYVIKNGKGKVDIKYTMDVDTKILQDILDKKPNIEFSTYSQEQHTIQNKRFGLGSAWIIAKPVLSEEEQSRLRKEINKNPEQNTHPVHFTTTPEDQGLIYHLDLLSPDDFESLHEDPRYRKFALDHLINKLIDAAMFENQGIDIDVLINCFDSAAKQSNDYGKPYNMLPRASAEELKLSLEAHIPKLKNSQRLSLFSKLIALELLSEADTGLILN